MTDHGETKGGGEMSDEQRSVDDLAPAYALDALTAEERARFEAEASPAARREAAELADIATLLSSDEVAPPPGLRASILDAIREEPQEPAAPSAAPPLASDALPSDALPNEASDRPSRSGPRAAAPDPLDATDASDAAPATPVIEHGPAAPREPGPAERRARARWRPLQLVGAVAASAALLAGGIVIGTQLGGPSQQEALGAVVAADDAQRSEVELEGGATATVIWSAEHAQSVLLFEGLGAAPHGHEYQAWYIDAAGPHSAGVFQADDDSTAVLLEGEMSAGVAVGVTVEPEGGSEAPTTEPFLVVQT